MDIGLIPVGEADAWRGDALYHRSHSQVSGHLTLEPKLPDSEMVSSVYSTSPITLFAH